jgi:feruloyl esterase
MGSATNPGNLRMLRYLPQKVQEFPPMVVVLHGCTQNAADYANGAGWIELADRFGFCLLLPEQRRNNNPNLCFNWFVPADTTRGSGEVESIRQMIDRTAADWNIDRDQIFVTGLSAGGAMASAMLATYPELFAGGAIIAGLPYGSASDIPGAFQAMGEGRTLPAGEWASIVRSASRHRGRWPKVSVWQGTADQTVNPRNADEIVKQWTTLHETGPKPDQEEKHSNYIRRVWNDAEGEPSVEEYVVSALGHGTPLATGSGDEHFGAAAPYLLEAGLSSSHRIAQFWEIDKGHPIRQTGRSEGEAPTATPQVRPAPQLNTVPRIDGGSARKPDENAPSPRHDVGAIINRALRSAGLIK